MTQPGDHLTNPVTRQSLVFRVTAEESNGELVEVESIYEAGSADPPRHYHPRQTERFEMLEGEIQVELEGEVGTLKPGDVLEIPPGKPHAMWNAGPERARVIWQTRPALGTQTFFETVWGLAQEGRVNAKGFPKPLQMAVLMRAYEGEIRLARPPRWVQQAVVGPLALLGKMLGYRERYERFSGPEAKA